MALPWLSSFASDEKSKSLEIVQAFDQRLATKLELCVKSGKRLIIKDCENVEPFLYPLLRKEIRYEDSRYFVMIGTKRVHYNKNFTLFLTSKKHSKNFPADVLRIVNFSVTKIGLKNRLVSALVNYKMPELKSDLRKLTEEEEKHGLALQELETKLLSLLCNTDGDLLENKDLVETLLQTRENATKLSNALKEFNDAKKMIHEHYRHFEGIATFASNLYFLLTKLKAVRFILYLIIDGSWYILNS